MRNFVALFLIPLLFCASCFIPNRTIGDDVLTDNQCYLELAIVDGQDLSSEMIDKSMTFLSNGLIGMPDFDEYFGKRGQSYAYWNHYVDGKYEYINIEDKVYQAFTGKYKASMIVHEGSPLEFVLLESNNDTLLLKVNRLVPL